jgi:hypothetical protein
MSKAIRTGSCFLVSLVLLSAIAQASANKNENPKKTAQHSKISKVAFWRHHKDGDKNPKHATAAASKHDESNKPQLKPVSAKQVTANKDQKQQHASGPSKVTSSKAVTPKTTKPQSKPTKPQSKTKAQQTASLKQ